MRGAHKLVNEDPQIFLEFYDIEKGLVWPNIKLEWV